MKNYGKIYSIALCVLLVGAEIALLAFSINETKALLGVLLGLVYAYALSPLFHEWGHASFAQANKLKVVGLKILFFSFEKNGRRWKFRFANPLSPDHTDVLPTRGGDMKSRAKAYAIGGLVGSGIFFGSLFIATVVVWCLGAKSWFLLGSLPYAAYLLLLNAAPFEYPTGKTDALVYRGLKCDEPSETAMVYAMEIQGRLFEGQAFSDIDEKYYFDFPQLMEDDPMYAMNLFLRYRFYLDKGDLENAADALNRLAASTEYLSEREETELAAELTYMHSLNGDKPAADECATLCKEYLALRSLTALRVLAAYSAAFGEKDKTDVLVSLAFEKLNDEMVLGVRMFEKRLIEKISSTDIEKTE